MIYQCTNVKTINLRVYWQQQSFQKNEENSPTQVDWNLLLFKLEYQFLSHQDSVKNVFYFAIQGSLKDPNDPILMKWTPQNSNMGVCPALPELDCSQLQTNMTRTEVGQSQDTVQCILYNSIEAELCFLASFLHAQHFLKSLDTQFLNTSDG